MALRWIENNPFNAELPVWTRALAGELLPGPVTPLGWDAVWRGAAVDGWRDAMVERLGFDPDEIDADAPELLGVFGGYAYLNASLLRVWAARTPALAPDHFDTAYLVDHRDMPGYEPADWHRRNDSTRGPLTQWLSWVLADRSQSELEAGHVLSVEARANRPDLAALSDGDLVDRALRLRPLCRALFAQHINQTLAATIGPGIIAAVCDEVGLPTSTTALLAGLGDVESVWPANALWSLSRLVHDSIALTDLFDEGVPGLLDRLAASEAPEAASLGSGIQMLASEVGFRGTTEWEPHGATWETDPELLLVAIDQLRRRSDDADPGLGFASREAERRTLVKEIGEAVARNPVTRDHFDAAVTAAGTFIKGRERSKANVARVIHEIRVALQELGERAAGRGDVREPADLHMLFVDELAYYADGGLSRVREITDGRRAHHRWLRSLRPPFIVKSEPSPVDRRLATPAPTAAATASLIEAGGVLFGKPGSSGVGQGRARVVADPEGPISVGPGEVVVASVVPAAWGPLLIGAAAVVIESGGLLSHATIICRDLGLPVVVGATGATERIPDGAVIEADGGTGIVTVLRPPEQPLFGP